MHQNLSYLCDAILRNIHHLIRDFQKIYQLKKSVKEKVLLLQESLLNLSYTVAECTGIIVKFCNNPSLIHEERADEVLYIGIDGALNFVNGIKMFSLYITLKSFNKISCCILDLLGNRKIFLSEFFVSFNDNYFIPDYQNNVMYTDSYLSCDKMNFRFTGALLLHILDRFEGRCKGLTISMDTARKLMLPLKLLPFIVLY